MAASALSGDRSSPAFRCPEEIHWVNRQPHLKNLGYALRRRYQPEWQPSWGPDRVENSIDFEDAIPLPMRNDVIDAFRISDRLLVYIKKVGRDSEELRIAKYLRSDELQKDPRNHSVPILDVLHLPGDEDSAFIVMPFLRYIDSPSFELVSDVLQCGEELLEGLVFLHEHNVAHRDCAYKNVMMDARAMYPQGHHPILNEHLPDCSRIAPVLPRARAGVKYYYTDFGISTMFPAENKTKLVSGSKGLDKSPPELSDTVPYDPFKLDVYILGNLFSKTFAQKYRNLSMLDLVIEKMTARDPEQRPTAKDALREWQVVQENTNMMTSGWRLQPVDEHLFVGVVRDALHPLFLLYTAISHRSVSTFPAR